MRRPPRFGLVPVQMLALFGTPCALAGCAGPYDRALRDMAQPHSDRVAVRVDELIECASHAADSLNRVAQWYATHDPAPEAPEPAALRIARGEAEAAAFEAARRAMSVGDVIAEMDPDAALRLHPTLEAANTVAASLDRAALAMNAGNPSDAAGLAALRAAIAEADRAIDTLRDQARSATTR